MSRRTAWSVHVATLLVGITGVVYGWMRYFATPADEFAVVNHPWQPALQAWHVVLAPALVFTCALIWSAHVWQRIRSGFTPRRRSGMLLAGLFVPMVASGYLLQVSADEPLRTAWIWVHATTSTLWIGIYVAHQLAPRKRRLDRLAVRPEG